MLGIEPRSPGRQVFLSGYAHVCVRALICAGTRGKTLHKEPYKVVVQNHFRTETEEGNHFRTETEQGTSEDGCLLGCCAL
jgi:hypothetical protein